MPKTYWKYVQENFILISPKKKPNHKKAQNSD